MLISTRSGGSTSSSTGEPEPQPTPTSSSSPSPAAATTRRRTKRTSSAKRSGGIPTAPRHRGFDVAADLADNAAQYAGTEWVGLCVFPAFLRTCVDRIRSRAAELSSSRPGISPAVTCCMMYGLQLIAGNAEVREMLQMKAQLDAVSSDDLDAGDVDELAGWFRSFPLSVPDDRMIGVRRLNVNMPSIAKQMLHELSGELGASASTLAVIAVGVGIQTQPAMLEGHRESLDKMVDVFFRRVARRKRVAEGLLAEAVAHAQAESVESD